MSDEKIMKLFKEIGDNADFDTCPFCVGVVITSSWAVHVKEKHPWVFETCKLFYNEARLEAKTRVRKASEEERKKIHKVACDFYDIQFIDKLEEIIRVREGDKSE